MNYSNNRTRWAEAAAGIGSLTLILVGLQASPASADEGYLVHTDSGSPVNVRTGAGTDHPVVGTLNSGEQVNVYCTEYDNTGAVWDDIGVTGW
jgi:uncharacterized protein YraI